MRICVDIRLLSKNRFSGIPEYSALLLSALFANKKKNDEFVLFYNGFRKLPLPAEWISAAAILEKSWPNKLLDFSGRLFNRPRFDRLIKADGYFSPHFNNLPLSEPFRRTITFHDLSFIHHPDFFSRRQRFWHWLQDYKRQALTAGRLIAVSDFTKSDLMNYFSLPPERVTRVYSGVNPFYERIKINDPGLLRFKQEHNLFRPFIFYLGSLDPRKNILLAAKALCFLKKNKAARDWQFVLAGSLGWQGEKILEEIRKTLDSRDIIYLGTVSRQSALYLYNLAGIFVYPSFFEGFGFQPLEAQACGAPVIASNRSSLPEILGASALLADPWRVDRFAETLNDLMKDNKLRNSLIKAGFENIKRFDWQKTAQATLKVIYESR